MTEEKAGSQISSKAFIQSLIILLVMMIGVGVLTLIVPAGQYARTLQAGRDVIDPNSFQIIARPDYPIWRWLVAPLEVLGGPDGLTIITIILFILMVGASFAVLDHSGIIKAVMGRIVKRFGRHKYRLLLAITLFFMVLGAFFGIFEEVLPLVPVMIALSYWLGWDSLVGLGMSILATNMGFSAALTNPFTLGVAQKLAGLPLFSGLELRIPIFLAIYAVLALFLVRYAKRIDRSPQASAVYGDDQAARAKYQHLDLDTLAAPHPHLRRAVIWFVVCVALILIVLMTAPFLPAIADYSLPIVGILFLIGGIGAGLLGNPDRRKVWQAAGQGVAGIAPGIVLILMAASIKYIAAQGGIMDTVLHSAVQTLAQAGPFAAALLVYGLALVIEFFVASGSAKAFLIMPILLPLADLIGVTRQTTVLGYTFGDGFSNLAYPTNPVLLIALGLTVVSYPKWLKWTLPLWFWVILISLAFLGLAVALNYGPF